MHAGFKLAGLEPSVGSSQLKGDSEAREMFVGEDCGLCTDENRETQSKRLE